LRKAVVEESSGEGEQWWSSAVMEDIIGNGDQWQRTTEMEESSDGETQQWWQLSAIFIPTHNTRKTQPSKHEPKEVPVSNEVVSASQCQLTTQSLHKPKASKSSAHLSYLPRSLIAYPIALLLYPKG
jgi:hypothetical protein